MTDGLRVVRIRVSGILRVSISGAIAVNRIMREREERERGERERGETGEREAECEKSPHLQDGAAAELGMGLYGMGDIAAAVAAKTTSPAQSVRAFYFPLSFFVSGPGTLALTKY